MTANFFQRFCIVQPIQARKWLKLLQNDKISGIRIIPKLNLSPDYFGFSFSSNKLGLRGPCDIRGENVIFGTSFAMGFGVDNGKNWYEKCFHSENYINFGLPVGEKMIKSLFEYYYIGPSKNAWVLYYPNFWNISKRFDRYFESGRNVFDFFRWETDYNKCVKMQLAWDSDFQNKLAEGTYLSCSVNGYQYYHTPNIYYFDYGTNRKAVRELLMGWEQILSHFEKIYIIRVPTKTDVWPEQHSNIILQEAKKNFRKGWELAKHFLCKNRRISFLEPDSFCLSDYYPFDSHWTESGNAKMADYIKFITTERL